MVFARVCFLCVCVCVCARVYAHVCMPVCMNFVCVYPHGRVFGFIDFCDVLYPIQTRGTS